ncbi:hypothetical protein RI534_13165 [Aeromonas allosaccharophila]|uniref:hypothetical protein n=1 Tax=Aeromonas allosaccharophila TaxID=656 RepID=UPI00342D0D44
MVKAFFLLMYVFVALFVLAHVPYEGGVGWQMLQAPVVWVITAGWVMVMFPRQIARLLSLSCVGNTRYCEPNKR